MALGVCRCFGSGSFTLRFFSLPRMHNYWGLLLLSHIATLKHIRIKLINIKTPGSLCSWILSLLFWVWLQMCTGRPLFSCICGIFCGSCITVFFFFFLDSSETSPPKRPFLTIFMRGCHTICLATITVCLDLSNAATL